MASSKLQAQNLTDITGLVAVVTGGGTGIGLIIARTLEANGATVYITGRREKLLEEAAKQAIHGKIIPIQGSTTSHDDLQRAVDIVTEQTGHINLLVCNAGMSSYDSSPNARPKPTAASSVSEIRDYYFNYRPDTVWDNVLATNVRSVFTTSMAFLELLDAGNKRNSPNLPRSQIVAIGSVGGYIRFGDSFIYSASKAGVHHLMNNLSNFFAPHGIRTNVIAPGWFPSEMTTSVTKTYEPSGGVMPKDLVPQERMGNEEEMGGTILYFASKAGGYCNGSTIVIDGGLMQIKA